MNKGKQLKSVQDLIDNIGKEITFTFRGDPTAKGFITKNSGGLVGAVTIFFNSEENTGWDGDKSEYSKLNPDSLTSGWNIGCRHDFEELADIYLVQSMPELRAGQLVSTDGKNYYMYMPHVDGSKRNYLMFINNKGSNYITNITPDEITSIREIKSLYHSGVFFNHEKLDLSTTELVWGKNPEPVKTEAELKIEELEQTVQIAMDQIQELKETK